MVWAIYGSMVSVLPTGVDCVWVYGVLGKNPLRAGEGSYGWCGLCLSGGSLLWLGDGPAVGVRTSWDGYSWGRVTGAESREV